MTIFEKFQAAHVAACGGDFAGSELLYKEVLGEDDTQIEAWAALARMLSEQGKYGEAIAAARRALAIEPKDSQKLCLMGGIQALDGNLDEALYYYDLTLRYSPDHALVRWNRAVQLLLRGRYEEGWAEYEWGRAVQVGGVPIRPTRTLRPQWDGKPMPGQTLLVWHEQGLGDTLQFARFLAAAKERSQARVIFECQEELIPLLRDIDGVDQIVRPATDACLPLPSDEHISLMSLPHALGMANTFPFWRGSYVSAKPMEMPKTGNLRVGLCWKGNPSHANDKNRSMDMATIAPLATVPDVEAYSLVPGEVFDHAQVDASRAGAPSHSLVDLKDWSTTASLIAALDVVVTVDTAVAHLAGAMGKPVLLFVPKLCDWRWDITNETRTPWYPGTTLLRQETSGDWSGSIASAMAILKEKVNPFE